MAETMTCYRHPNRETGVSCSECGRGICPDCMRFAPVGIRCPEHAGNQKVVRGISRKTPAQLLRSGGEGIVTRTLIGINVAVYLLTLAAGASVNGVGGRVYEEGVLYGPFVANGDWWRLITSAFMHYGPLHLGVNMYSLWLLGGALESALGRVRYLAVYLVAGLAGSAGALVVTPNSQTLGASGAIFGVMGALFVLERQGLRVFGGSVGGLIVVNLLFTYFSGAVGLHISLGGHVGGLGGGALAALALSRFGRGHAAYGKPGLVGIVGLVGVAVASVAVAYWSVAV